MPYQDLDQTLPPAAALPGASRAERQLLLTVIFHPDLSRIGQVAVVPGNVGREPWVLGRSGPDFAGCGRPAAPLEDRHVSRHALEFEYGGTSVRLRRAHGSSRCQLGSGELFDTIELDDQTLQQGVPLLLSHSVVLMLRFASGRRCDSEEDETLIGSSCAMAALREQIAHVAQTDDDVLIRGETGSGKEVVAAALHAQSARAARPMVSVNMAAIPAELAPAALFGSARGAFTGAEQASPGYFREAAGGTLFLDEIGEAASAVQPLLLRALQQREIQSVGGPIERIDLRVISATDAALTQDSGFKSALRHRLAAQEITVPPLRQHPEDIGQLLLFFLSRAERASPSPHVDMEEHCVAAWAHIFFLCARYPWPGNVRELCNIARQVMLSNEGRPRLTDSASALLMTGGAGHSGSSCRARRPRMRDISDAEFERSMLDNAFEIQAVARDLQVSRTSVYRRIEHSKKYQLATDVSATSLRAALAAADGCIDRAALGLCVSATSLRSRARKLSVSQG